MFNLKQAITEWRRKMSAAGLGTPEVLDELENHLREDVGALVSAGTPEMQAFETAVARIGSPGSVGAEFKRMESTSGGPVTIGSLLWLAASAVLAIFLLRGLIAGKLSPLLSAHIFTLTTGYGAAFLTGAFGIYYVCCRWSRNLFPARQQALSRAVLLSSLLSVALVTVGVLLGMIWSRQNLGIYLGSDPREIGPLCASVWLIAFCMFQRFGQVSERTTMLLGIGGNVIISLAWFGAHILAHNPTLHGYGIATFWQLELLLAVHLLFLVLGLVPIPEEEALNA
jgi:hypothetical protein